MKITFNNCKNFPDHDENLIIDDTVSMAIQVNGRLRGTIEVTKNMNKEELVAALKEIG